MRGFLFASVGDCAKSATMTLIKDTLLRLTVFGASAPHSSLSIQRVPRLVNRKPEQVDTHDQNDRLDDHRSDSHA